MKARIIDRDALGAVSPSGLRAYLLAQGWSQGDEVELVGHYYTLEGQGELLVPSSARLPDYASVVGEILGILSAAEDRDEPQILRDLSLSDTDVIRVRLPEADPDGSLTMEQGLELVKQSKDLLLAAACAAVEPKRAYRAGKVIRATEYLREVRMGQSEKGSFVLTLLSPVPPSLEHDRQIEMWPELAAEPFSRQVTRRLSIILEEVNTALFKVNAGADISAFDEAVSKGVSANICEAAAKLVETGDGLDVSVTWARTRRGPEPIHHHAFHESDKEILYEVARLLKNQEPRESEVLEGYVERLNRKTRQKVGTATLQVSLDGRLTSVAAQFDPEMYNLIADAHKDRRGISIEGDLVRDGQRWRLERPRHLTVKPPSDEAR